MDRLHRINNAEFFSGIDLLAIMMPQFYFHSLSYHTNPGVLVIGIRRSASAYGNSPFFLWNKYFIDIYIIMNKVNNEWIFIASRDAITKEIS